MMCPMVRTHHVECYKPECMRDAMCMKSEAMPTREERKEGMKKQEEKLLRAWLNAPADEIQRYIDAIKTIQSLDTDSLARLLDFAALMADEKKRSLPPPKAKRGRPKTKKDGGE